MIWGLQVCRVPWHNREWVDETFTDSKTLSHEKRAGLLSILSSRPEHMGWSVRVLWYAGVQSRSADAFGDV